MDERLQSELGHGGVNGANVVERILAREHDALDAEFLHHRGAALVVHGHLRRAMNLELRIHLLN